MHWDGFPKKYQYMSLKDARDLQRDVFNATLSDCREDGYRAGTEEVLGMLARMAGDAWFVGNNDLADFLRQAHRDIGLSLRHAAEKVRKRSPPEIELVLALGILECAAADVAAWPEPREGVLRIAAERVTQVKKGYDAEHDNDHVRGELALVAGELALAAAGHPEAVRAEPTDPWGLVAAHYDDPLRQLVIAGALIAAEIERRLREADAVLADAAELASASSVEDSVAEAVTFCTDLAERSKELSDEEGAGVAMTDAEKRTVPMSRATERDLARRGTRLGVEERSDDRQEGAS